MKYGILKYGFAILFSVVSLVASAQSSTVESTKVKSEVNTKKEKKQKEPVKVSTEFGLAVGGLYNFMEIVPVSENFTQKITGVLGDKVPGNIGAVAALQFRINIGKTFGIQPEIMYSYSTLKFSGPEHNGIKVKCSLVQMPLLLSFRAAMFRFNFGPVFTLTDNPTYQLATSEVERVNLFIGPLNPKVTYAAGISVRLGQRALIDVRWASQFKKYMNAEDIKNPNEFLWTQDPLKQTEHIKFGVNNSSIQVRLGLVF